MKLTQQSFKDSSSLDRDIEAVIGQQAHIIFPIARAETDHQATGMDRGLCTQNRGLRLHTFHHSFSGSQQTLAIKTGQLQQQPPALRFSGYEKPSPWGVRGGTLALESDENLKWSEELANRLEL